VDPEPRLTSVRNRSWRRTALYAALVLFVAALAVDGVFGAHGLIVTYRTRLQVERQQQKLQQLKKENREFSQQVRELKSSPSAIEHVAHERMGLVKPGELVFKLPDGKSNSTTKQQPPKASTQH
jgi:cell division protein FtsB